MWSVAVLCDSTLDQMLHSYVCQPMTKWYSIMLYPYKWISNRLLRFYLLEKQLSPGNQYKLAQSIFIIFVSKVWSSILIIRIAVDIRIAAWLRLTISTLSTNGASYLLCLIWELNCAKMLNGKRIRNPWYLCMVCVWTVKEYKRLKVKTGTQVAEFHWSEGVYHLRAKKFCN